MLVGVTLLAMLPVACSGDEGVLPDDAFAVRASTDVGVGRDRLLVGVARPDGTRLGGPDVEVTFELAPLDPGADPVTVPATYTWMLDGVSGVYRAEFEFDRPGTWTATLRTSAGDELEPLPFTVLEETSSPGLGDPAPPSPSPTLADHTLEQLTTDPEPDPRLYRTSIAEAVTSGRPAVIVFSTPAFCQTAACGPILENVKAAIDDHPDVTFVHVEVYTGLDEPDFAPDAAHIAPAVVEWGLTSEPWVFVVDGAGKVAGRYEGVLDPAELEGVLG
jgi:hypothetical protein